MRKAMEAESRCRVVVVDDSPLIRDGLTRLIEMVDGIDVVGQAEDATQGLELVRALAPDAVTLDIMMPNGNGLELLEQIKRLPSSPTVILLTNYPYPAFKKRCVELGADFFLNKGTEFTRVPRILLGEEGAIGATCRVVGSVAERRQPPGMTIGRRCAEGAPDP